MPKVRALTPAQAQATFAARFAPAADKLRQIATNLGIRPYRVTLIWTRWSGTERGEGVERVVQTQELLPTPKVASLDNLSFSLMHAGTIPIGSVSLTGVSLTYTEDLLRGLVVPLAHEDEVPEPFDFFYELVEDGRGDPQPQRQRYRLLKPPFRRAGVVDWSLWLQRVAEDRGRDGTLAGAP